MIDRDDLSGFIVQICLHSVRYPDNMRAWLRPEVVRKIDRNQITMRILIACTCLKKCAQKSECLVKST
jgi:hypothetical protein